MYRTIIFSILAMLCLVSCEQNQQDYPTVSFGAEAVLVSNKTYETSFQNEKEISRLAFGSCNKHDLPQPLWKPIVENKPDLWIWLGDIIYGDTQDPAVLKGKYAAQKLNEDYQALEKSCSIIGTWDDHDYGANDGDKTYPMKEKSKEILLDFLCVPNEAPVRKRAGIYQSYTYGEGERKVKIILLDSRTFRDKLQRDDKKSFIPDENADILGEAQWTWLENELKNNDAPITFIINGTQVISREHSREKWYNFPSSRKRLFKLIGTHCKSGVMLISGDRHHGEISKLKIPNLNHYLYEFTASGLTHTHKYDVEEQNKFRVGKQINKLNFGVLNINWDASPLSVTLEIRGEENKLYQEMVVEFTE